MHGAHCDKRCPLEHKWRRMCFWPIRRRQETSLPPAPLCHVVYPCPAQNQLREWGSEPWTVWMAVLIYLKLLRCFQSILSFEKALAALWLSLNNGSPTPPGSALNMHGLESFSPCITERAPLGKGSLVCSEAEAPEVTVFFVQMASQS